MPDKTIDFNESIIKSFVESIRPEDEEVRKQIDIGYSYEKNVIVLFEIRPVWDNPKEILHNEFAKIRYYKSKKEWTLYWMRASGNWEVYKPFPTSSHLEPLIEVIKKDKHACFLG